jgi:hypothetical protein
MFMAEFAKVDVVTSIEQWESISGYPAKQLNIAGQVVTVRPFRMGQLGKVLKMVGPSIRESFNESGDINIVDLIINSFDQVNQVLAFACKKDIEFIENLPLDEGIKLAEEVYNLNKDFFFTAILPQIQKIFPDFKLNLALVQEPENGLMR